MKKAFTILAGLVLLCSCEIENHRESMFAEPVPCHVETISANIGRISTNEKYGTPEIVRYSASTLSSTSLSKETS